MGLGDKIRNAATKRAAQAKEAAGKAGDNRFRAEGRGEQVKADLKQAAERVKDAFKKH